MHRHTKSVTIIGRTLSSLALAGALAACAVMTPNITPQPTTLAGYWVSHDHVALTALLIHPDGTGTRCFNSRMPFMGREVMSLIVANGNLNAGPFMWHIKRSGPAQFTAVDPRWGAPDYAFTRVARPPADCAKYLK